mmetsp:Transcript_86190/g.150358  ORF Transcript_86190/g.150358 Transcript_86190/m.150358 type:complete len:641 (+) Transcript_86190:21-1943(+)
MAVVVNLELLDLVAPWDFHFDLLGPGSPPLPWVDGPDEEDEPTSTSEIPKPDAAGENGNINASSPVVDRKDRKKEQKLEKKGGLARGFLTKAAPAKESTVAEKSGNTKATAAQEATGSSSSKAESKATKKKKLAPGHYWTMPPQRYEFTTQSEIKVEQWRGVEQIGEVQKPTKAGVCRFFRLPALLPARDVDKILSACKQSKAYQTNPDSVDQTPTFEFYPFRDGEWVDMAMKPLLEGVVDHLVLPYIRERYDCRFCAVADILIRRYIPGERRTHAVHFDGHAFVTAVLGLCSPDDYEGGIYLQPEPDVSSRMFLRIDPGDLVVHSFDLQHGVHIWKGARYSLIIWVKDSLQAVRERTTPWYDKFVEAGDADALYNVAQNYEYGTFGRPLDINKAIQLYERSAAAGHHFAQNNLGLIYRRAHEKAGLSNGLQRSVEWLRAAAEAGFAMGQKNLALAYANGQGVKKDDAQAVVWMRRAAEQLEVEAAYMMGEMYRQGRGVPLDASEAAKWYERSAESGFPKAQYTFGMLFLEGNGRERDIRKAEMWLRFAAKQGHAEAKNNMATMHAQRGEVDQAAEIWADLAKGGEPNAQCNIGMCYMRGAGRKQDFTEARKWLSSAAQQGHSMAVQALVQLGSMPGASG